MENSPDSPTPESTEPDAAASPSKDAKTMAVLSHILGLFTSIIVPLIIWLLKREEDEYIDDQAKEALNFQITILIATVASFVLMTIWIGALLLPIVGLCNLIFAIIATIKANDGVRYRYPIALRLIR